MSLDLAVDLPLGDVDGNSEKQKGIQAFARVSIKTDINNQLTTGGSNQSVIEFVNESL